MTGFALILILQCNATLDAVCDPRLWNKNIKSATLLSPSRCCEVKVLFGRSSSSCVPFERGTFWREVVFFFIYALWVVCCALGICGIVKSAQCLYISFIFLKKWRTIEDIIYWKLVHIPWICYERSFSEFYLSIWNQLVLNQRLQLFVQSLQSYLLIFAWRN